MANPFNRIKILIVEDQPESRMLLRKMLEEMGCREVFEADDGYLGLKMLGNGSHGIDLVLCDWNMPVMSGIEFLRRMHASGMNIPFMMITGRGDYASVVEAQSNGVSGYIRKPYAAPLVEAKLRIMMQYLDPP